MKVRTIEDYLVKTGIQPDHVFSKAEVLKIVNEHVIAVYKGRVKLLEEKDFTGYEIADKLQTIESVFSEAIQKAFEDEEEDD